MKAGMVVSAAVIEGDKILLVQEGKEPGRGRWNIPSGRLENNEVISAGVIREVREETGYQIVLTGLTGIYNFNSETGNRLMRFNFNGRITGGEALCDGEEILAVGWFGLGEVEEMDDGELWNARSIREILKDIRAGKSYPIELLRELL